MIMGEDYLFDRHGNRVMLAKLGRAPDDGYPCPVARTFREMREEELKRQMQDYWRRISSPEQQLQQQLMRGAYAQKSWCSIRLYNDHLFNQFTNFSI